YARDRVDLLAVGVAGLARRVVRGLRVRVDRDRGHLFYAVLAGFRPGAIGGAADVLVLRDLLSAVGVPIGVAVAGAGVPALSRGGVDAQPDHGRRRLVRARTCGLLCGHGGAGTYRGFPPPEAAPSPLGSSSSTA